MKRPFPVLLINPFYPIDETPSPPLGLAFLAGALEAAGCAVRVLDLVVEAYHPERLQQVLDDFQPRLVGATAVTMTFDHAVAVLADIKALAPEAVTVMGGPHVTFWAGETLNRYPAVDIVARGEGETTIVNLAGALAEAKDWSQLPGIVFRNAGAVVDNGWPVPQTDLDALAAPARHLLPLGRYRALHMPISMTTSRGCPHGCIFCVGRKMVGARVRYRNPVRVVDELADIAAYGFHQVNLADDLFTASAGHCLAVCDEILRRGLEVRWTSFARVDTVSTDLLKRMRQAGCQAVSFGIESGDPGILKTIRKGITLAQVEAAVAMCHDAGLMPHGSFILGLPGETPETIARTLAFGRRLEAMGVSYGFHLLAPFPGTRVRDRAAEYGLKILTDDWRQYHANRAIVETASVPAARLDEIAGGWKERFDAYLGDIQRRMATGTASADEADTIVNLERTVLLYDLMMGELLETDPGDATESDSAAALGALSRRLAARCRHDAPTLHAALTFTQTQGNLRRQWDGRAWRWGWVDQL
ncbi:MAG: radical SAM protein [Desulfobacteraceae bacterium]|nr:radical SAM protein [Desulfobacteraceae bacterium]